MTYAWSKQSGPGTITFGSGTAEDTTASANSDGAYVLRLTATDAAGNSNYDELTFTWDTTAPTVDLSTTGNTINLSNATSFTVSGTCSEEGRTVYISGAISGNTTCSSASFSINLDYSAITEGNVSILADLADAAGNNAIQASKTVTKDTKPTATISGAPTGTSRTGVVDITIAGTGVQYYKYKIGISASTDCSSSSGYSADVDAATHITDNITGLADGLLKVCVVGKNQWGHYQLYSNASSATWTKDRTPPNAATALTAARGNAHVQLDWADGGGDTYQYIVVRRAGSAVTWTPSDGFSYSVGAVDANHTVAFVGAVPDLLDTSLTNGTTYYYSVFAYDAVLNYASATSANAKPMVSPLKSMQSGTVAFSTTDTSKDVTITSVNTSKAFLMFSFSSAATDADDGMIMGVMTNATTLTFSRAASGSAVSVSWYVAEYEYGVSVQRGTSTNNSKNTAIAISSVDLSKSFPILSSKQTNTSLRDSTMTKGYLLDSTTLRLDSSEDRSGMTYAWQVVQFDAATVQSGSYSFSTASTNLTIPTAVNTTSTLVLLPGYTTNNGSTNLRMDMISGTLTNSTTIALTKGLGGSTTSGYWYAVEFSEGTSVQKGANTLSTGVNAGDITVNAIDLARTMALTASFNSSSGRTSATSDFGAITIALTPVSATSFEVERNLTTSTLIYGWQVIEFAQ